jgi:hypothetical protein
MTNRDIEAVADSKSVRANAPSEATTPGHMDEGELVILTNEDVCPYS